MLNLLQGVAAPLVLSVLLFWLFQVPDVDLSQCLNFSEDFAGRHEAGPIGFQKGIMSNIITIDFFCLSSLG